MDIGPVEDLGGGVWARTVLDGEGETHIISVMGQGRVSIGPDRATGWSEYEVQVDNRISLPGERIWSTRERAFEAGMRYLEEMTADKRGGVT